jgi:branched-chain amino acid transport system permease protein
MFTFANSINVMMYVVVGGIAHTLTGPVVGALIVTFIPEYLRLAKEYEPVVTAAAIILIIIFLPTGLLGFLQFRLKPCLSEKWQALRRKNQQV